jgi:hypothetical protein
MKIVIQRGEQRPEITIDFRDVHYPWAIRETLRTALMLDGFVENVIDAVFDGKEYAVYSPEDDKE